MTIFKDHIFGWKIRGENFPHPVPQNRVFSSNDAEPGEGSPEKKYRFCDLSKNIFAILLFFLIVRTIFELSNQHKIEPK